MKKPVHYCLLLLLLCSNTLLLIAQDEQPYILKPVGDEAYEAILQFYQYDRDIPLEVQIVETVDNENFIREKIVFRGVRESRVVGYLATPKTGEPPYPCVLQMHGMTLSKSDFWHDFQDPFELITRDYHHGELVTEALLSSGYAVLALDMPYHGERSYENNFETTYSAFFNKGWGYRLRDIVVQSTLEYRRALDYLEIREDIDANLYSFH